MRTYKLYTRLGKTIPDAVCSVNEDGSSISFVLNADNPEEKAYLAWVAEGNEPLPAENE